MADSLNIIAAARAAMNNNQAVNAEDLLRIKVGTRGSWLALGGTWWGSRAARCCMSALLLEQDRSRRTGSS
jgi:hypothetical protein